MMEKYHKQKLDEYARSVIVSTVASVARHDESINASETLMDYPSRYAEKVVDGEISITDVPDQYRQDTQNLVEALLRGE